MDPQSLLQDVRGEGLHVRAGDPCLLDADVGRGRSVEKGRGGGPDVMGYGRRAGGAIEVQEDGRVAENDRKGDRQDDVEDGVPSNGISIFFKDDS